MSEFKHHAEIKIGSEKSFGVVFGIVFLLIGLYPLVTGGLPRWWAMVIALIFILLAYLAPKVFSVPNRLWFKFGLLLGSIVAPVVMALVYFLTVAPIGLIMRLIRKDLLNQKLDSDAESYWIERDHPVGTMKDQF